MEYDYKNNKGNVSKYTFQGFGSTSVYIFRKFSKQ